MNMLSAGSSQFKADQSEDPYCPGPQPEDLSPRGRPCYPCGRDKDGGEGLPAQELIENETDFYLWI